MEPIGHLASSGSHSGTHITSPEATGSPVRLKSLTEAVVAMTNEVLVVLAFVSSYVTTLGWS